MHEHMEMMEQVAAAWAARIADGSLPETLMVWVWWLPYLGDPSDRCGVVLTVTGGPN